MQYRIEFTAIGQAWIDTEGITAATAKLDRIIEDPIELEDCTLEIGGLKITAIETMDNEE